MVQGGPGDVLEQKERVRRNILGAFTTKARRVNFATAELLYLVLRQGGGDSKIGGRLHDSGNRGGGSGGGVTVVV